MSELFELPQMDDDDAELALDEKYLTFMLGEEEFGIDIRYVTEIIGIQSITFVPDLPNYVKGIINLRGQIIPVVDVRLRFGKEVLEYNDRTCIIVIQIRELSIGYIVDSVAECDQIPESRILTPPRARKSYHQKYVSGIGQVQDKIILILDCEKMVEDELEGELVLQ